MKPVTFKVQNTAFAKDQEQYGTIPTLHMEGPSGTIVSCWELSEEEIAEVVKTGKMWLGLMCFGKPLTPSFLSVNSDDFFQEAVSSCSSCGINNVNTLVNNVDAIVINKECENCASISEEDLNE